MKKPMISFFLNHFTSYPLNVKRNFKDLENLLLMELKKEDYFLLQKKLKD